MLSRRLFFGLGVLLLAFSLCACGEAPVSATLACEPARTGNVTKTLHLDGTPWGGGYSTNEASLLTGGDYMGTDPNPYKDARRVFVSFDLTTLPAGAVIQSAKMRLYLASSVGNPTSLGAVKAEHIYFGIIDPLTLTVDEVFSGLLFAPQISGSFSTDVTPGWHELDVTAAVKADLAAAHGQTQFRLGHTQLYPTSETNSYEDWKGPAAASEKPELVVTYKL